MWIGNCDQKASFLLTMLGVVATVICTSDWVKTVKQILVEPFLAYCRDGVGDFDLLKSVIALLMISGLGFIFAAIIWTLCSLMAKTDYDKEKQEDMSENSRLHYASIAKMTYADFLQEDEDYDYDNDLISQIYINSKICDAKFKKYNTSLALTFVAIPLLAIAFVLLLFA